MLLEVLSEALGISLLEVINYYYSKSDDVKRDCLIGDVLDRKQTEEEGEEWLKEEAWKRDVVAALIHCKREDNSF
jgi:hypothetical protein